MTIARKIAAAATMTGAALLAAACSSAPSHTVGNAAPAGGFSAAAAAQPANPVPILRLTGAKVPASEKLGDHDVFGNRMADGTFRSGEDVSVSTPAVSLRQAESEAPGDFTVDDSHAVIIGHGFWVNVTAGARFGSDGAIRTVFPVSPSVIARRVHGHLVTPR